LGSGNKQKRKRTMKKNSMGLVAGAVVVSTLISAFAQGQSTNMPPKDWKLLQLYGCYGDMRWDANGTITQMGDAALDFAFENAPVLKLVASTKTQSLEFPAPMPKGIGTVKIAFTNASAGGASARIPRFKPEMKGSGTNQYFVVHTFQDFPGRWDFEFSLGRSGVGSYFMEYLNCFQDGAEHHIYGQVELFGTKFNNTSTVPLVFRIEGKTYKYVSGVGTATTKDGMTTDFKK
jgi:hypothetical protein